MDIEELHTAACAAKQSFYIDPTSGQHVFTAYRLLQRPCCGCGCRHCPHNKSGSSATRGDTTCRLLHGDLDDMVEDDVDVLFWSGGKDSYLTLGRLDNKSVILLTTYEQRSGRVAHQGVDINADILPQVQRLNLPLLTVPLNHSIDYIKAVRTALHKILSHGLKIRRLVFGDLHLSTIRNWRDTHLESVLGDEQLSLSYPLWKVPYDQLLDDIQSSIDDDGVQFRICAVDDVAKEAGVCIGDVYDTHFVNRLPSHVDKFGENGEFHTLAIVKHALGTLSQ